VPAIVAVWLDFRYRKVILDEERRRKRAWARWLD
jgi:hypothetical protein